MIEPTQGPGATRQAASAHGASNYLGKDDFLKLLVGQLRNQNPMDPMGDQDFIAQMTQMSTLEQVTNLAVTNQRLDEAMASSRAVGLIGRSVQFVRSDDTLGEGVVESVTFHKGGPSLTIGGEPGIPASAVSEVR